MQEHKLSVIFEPSYTLYALNFLDHLFIPRSLPNEQMVCYFEEYLGDYHEKILQNIRKNLIKFETISEVLTPLLTADPEFNDLKLSELLRSPKYLINQYKSTSSYEKSSKAYRKFLKTDAESMIIQVGLLIKELEKAKFKTYWLQSCLPLVNKQIKCYLKEIGPLALPEKFGQPTQLIYVLSCLDTERVDRIHQKLIVSHSCSSKRLMYSWIETYLKLECLLMKPRGYERRIKRNSEVMHLYKSVKDKHSSIFDYIETTIKLAMTVYIGQEWSLVEQPYEYLKRYESGHYKLSLLFYQELEKQKPHQMIMQQWAQYLLERVDIQTYQPHGERIVNQPS